jgi:ketosteroid isomerase-like protein
MFRYLFVLALAVPAIASPQDGVHLPAYLLQLPPSVGTVLIAETDSSTLYRFRNGVAGVSYGDERYMSIGQQGVDKRRAWDRRTPLGIYFVTEQMDTSRLYERYGPMAFPLDYPNVRDRQQGRSGGGIWIHGVPDDDALRPPLDTDGCIALGNNDLLALQEELLPTVTPVIITRSIRWAVPAEIAAARAALAAALDAWADAQRSGDLYAYFSLYAAGFEYRGMDRNAWMRYRLAALQRAPIHALALDDVQLIADPEDEALLLSRFRLTLDGDDYKVATVKRLYWRRGDDGVLKIVAEDNG